MCLDTDISCKVNIDNSCTNDIDKLHNAIATVPLMTLEKVSWLTLTIVSWTTLASEHKATVNTNNFIDCLNRRSHKYKKKKIVKTYAY